MRYCRALGSSEKLHRVYRFRVHRMFFPGDIPHEVAECTAWIWARFFVCAREAATGKLSKSEGRTHAGGAAKHTLARRKEVDVTDLENESIVAHSVSHPFGGG